MFSSVALLAIAQAPWVLSAALSVAPVTSVPPVGCLPYSAGAVVPWIEVAIAQVPPAPPPALVALTPIPLLLVADGWSPEELGRFCLVRTGEVVSLRRALPLSRCPRFCSWPESSISMFSSYLFVGHVVEINLCFLVEIKDKKCTS